MTRVFLENWAPWVRLDPGENEETPEREENWDQPVCRAPRGSPERQVQMGPRGVLVLLELWVTWVLLVFRVCLENGASLVHQDPKETGEQSVRKDQREQLEMTAQEVLLVPWDR